VNLILQEKEAVKMSEIMTNETKDILLRDVAYVIVGQIMKSVTSKNGGGKTGGAVLARAADSDKYTRIGDVVIRLSAPYNSSVISSAAEEGLLIPSFCAAIRIKRNELLNANYLCDYLNSNYVRNQLSLMAAGTIRPMIKISDICALKIPVPARSMEDIGGIGNEK